MFEGGIISDGAHWLLQPTPAGPAAFLDPLVELQHIPDAHMTAAGAPLGLWTGLDF